MQIRPLSNRQKLYILRHKLNKKFTKQIKIFEKNSSHPSLHTELLEPKSEGVYSFRIDRKYRVLFVRSADEIEIIDINDHYK